MNQAISKNTFLLILLIAAICGFLVFGKTNLPKVTGPGTINTTTQNKNLNTYTSKDLKISFNYPKDWFVNEKDYDVMITSYKSKIGENKLPNENELMIFIDNFNGCHGLIEENLVDPGCGEGGSNVKKNTILSKESHQTQSGTFYKYIIESPSNKITYYLLQHDKSVLQIEKNPDPSQFEKEFEDLVNSIRFLD